ncbi:GNAT family N-acetyltransferase [Spirosoma sp. RP8]|uniref:GNAT family N-acetyltransferase n=1 Tax=Spirosoma liriopis TaxID=2937440 RepID=A0ABT0HFT2_9BACT|nr:GNAT family N-acetyltransferase [Spirosoma liriopis]MCK8490475.1 GNAT family N-acetyltransferase [Spirosoma liriopis]
MIIRPYEKTDAAQLISVFCKSVPVAFGENEISEYSTFLETWSGPYFVAEDNGKLLGACGYYSRDDRQEAYICWILSDPDAKGQGIGKVLLLHNLALIDEQPIIQRIVCETSQVAYLFFEKFGFELQHTKPDYWAPGLDLYHMILHKKAS